jgi:hypothetical protein
MKNELYQLSDSEIDDFDRIYDGVICEEDYYVIKAKLHLDEVLRHKYLIYKMLRNEIEQNGLSNKFLKNRLTELDRKSINKRRRFIVNSVVYSVVVIFMFFVLLNSFKKDVSLYEKYKNSETGLSIKMSNQALIPIEKAMIDIANKRYTAAISSLNNCNSTDTTLYYLAYCKEQLGMDRSALKTYLKLTISESTLIKDKSEFRIALLHLKHKNPSAITEFRNIAKSPSNQYQRLAFEIVESLEKR